MSENFDWDFFKCFNLELLFQTSEETDEIIAQNAIEMWMDDGCHLYPGDKSQLKVNEKPEQICDFNTDFIEPNFPMTTLIRINES